MSHVLMRKDSISVVRSTEKDIKDTEKLGFVQIGPCDADGNLLPEEQEPVVQEEVKEPKAKGKKA